MNVVIRTVADLPTLMRWRREVIEHVFGEVPSDALMEANRRYYATHIADGSHIAVVAHTDGEDAGCGAICLTEELPSPDNPSGRCAYLMNIYVRQPFRSRGIGRAIVCRLVEKAREARCDKIYLETTAAARPLYKRTGFEPLPGIMKYADIQSSES
jgi:GNAT superfamily N-acetyltransferase